MRRSNYPLRLQPSLMEEARKVAGSEGIALNQLFNVAVAEKLATLRTVRRFQEQIRSAGMRNPSSESDEISIGRLPALIATVTSGLQGPPAPQPDRAPDGKHAEEKKQAVRKGNSALGKLKKWLERTRSC
jgi:hypothetical protein